MRFNNVIFLTLLIIQGRAEENRYLVSDAEILDSSNNSICDLPTSNTELMVTYPSASGQLLWLEYIDDDHAKAPFPGLDIGKELREKTVCMLHVVNSSRKETCSIPIAAKYGTAFSEAKFRSDRVASLSFISRKEGLLNELLIDLQTGHKIVINYEHNTEVEKLDAIISPDQKHVIFEIKLYSGIAIFDYDMKQIYPEESNQILCGSLLKKEYDARIKIMENWHAQNSGVLVSPNTSWSADGHYFAFIEKPNSKTMPRIRIFDAEAMDKSKKLKFQSIPLESDLSKDDLRKTMLQWHDDTIEFKRPDIKAQKFNRSDWRAE